MAGSLPVLRLALPSKGMETETLDFLAAAGLKVNRSNPRQYRARIKSLPGTEVMFQRAADIFAKVAEGSVDLGITGLDIVREHQREDDETIIMYAGLGYGVCSLVVAVPESWIALLVELSTHPVQARCHVEIHQARVRVVWPDAVLTHTRIDIEELR